MAKFCDKCGLELKDENSKFCDKCGAKVNNAFNNTENNLTGVPCPNCGNNIPLGQKNCLKCGFSFEDNKNAIIVGYIVAVILSIFGLIPGIYLLTRENDKSKKQGIIICLISIMPLIGMILNMGLFQWIITIILIIIGIYLWIND